MAKKGIAKHRVISLTPGFYAIRCVGVMPKDCIAILRAVPLSSKSSARLMGLELNGEVMLNADIGMALVYVEGAEARITITVMRQSDDASASFAFDVERLSQKLPKNEAPSPSLVYLSGHVEWKGDLKCAPGKILGAEKGSARVEGFAVNWLKKIENLDIKYGCTFGAHQESSTAQGGAYVGTRRQSTPITSIWMSLDGSAAKNYALTYFSVFAKAGHVPGRQAEVVSGSDETDYLVGLWVSVVDAVSDSPDIPLQSGRKIKELKTFRA